MAYLDLTGLTYYDGKVKESINGNIAPIFSSSTDYTTGEYVSYNNAIYRFTADHSAGAWDSSDVTAVTVGEEVEDVKSGIDEYVYATSANLYNPANDTEGYGINSSGEVYEAATRKYSELIYIGTGNTVAIQAETSYSAGDGVMFVATYDSDQTFVVRHTIASSDGVKVLTLSNAAYIRLVMNVNLEDVMVNLGSTLLTYAAYGAEYSDTLDDHIVDVIGVDDIAGKLNEGTTYRWSSMVIPDSGTCADYEGLDGTGEFSSSTTLAELYAAWDALVTDYPDYITKTDLGTDASGEYSLYSYSFVPESIPLLNDNISPVAPPKVLLCGSVHGYGADDAGDQPEMAFALLYLFRNICENWKTDDALAYLRWHVQFEVLPVQNPWGFDNGYRRNSNMVDINRNFPYGWSLGTEGANDYGGASSLSEAESVIISDFIEANSDAIFHLDIHTTGGTQSQNKLVYFAMAAGSEMYYVANDLVLQLSEKWDSESIGGLEEMDFHGYISDSASTGNGQINHWVTKTVGIPSCIIEGFPTFTDNTTGLHSTTVMGMCMDELVNVIIRALNFFKH